MTAKERQEEILPPPRAPEGTTVVNDRCVIKTHDGHRLVLVSGVPLWQYQAGDRMGEAHAMVSLVERGWADQNDVARAFGYAARTVRRYQRRFEDGGLAALAQDVGYPKGRQRLRPSRRDLICRLKSEGHSNREIARRMGVSEVAIRKSLRRMGWKEARSEQNQLPLGDAPDANPNLSAFSSKAAAASRPHLPSRGANPNLSASRSALIEDVVERSLDTDPRNRWMDRLMARLGLLDDAAPLFGREAKVPGAGVLLALPALVQSGVFECAREIYGSIGPAFYGLRTTFLAFLFMALLRIRRPEAIKERPPADLGRVLGLDRAPEVKTLRRKLSRLAVWGRASQLGRALAERRVALRDAAVGFLYVDGHVRVYHGKHRLPKAHVARMRLSMPATTDYWVGDEDGDPLFVLTAEANAGLVKMLPAVLAEVRTVIGKRRLTVVFDRGGYSPKLFAAIVADGFDILTYRKGRFPRVPVSRFQSHCGVLDGREVTFNLADQRVLLLERKLRLRQVTRLSEDGHQTPILTSRMDLPALQIAYRMFARWRQENFFKYLREEYALDALADYKTVPDNPKREVPNPARAALRTQMKKAEARLKELQAEYGTEALENLERARPTMRGFKIAHGQIGRAISTARKRIEQLEAKRAAMPARVPIRDVVSGEIVKLAPERKHLTSLLKMVAFQAESDIVRLVASHYRRVEDEGRTLVQTILSSDADLEVQGKVLRVDIAPLSSAHRTRALAALCEELNRAATIFPGSHLCLRYRVRSLV